MRLGQKRKSVRRLGAAGIAILVAAAVAAGCGGDDDGGGGNTGDGSIDGTALEGAELTVGSKEFTEQKLLGAITVQALEAAGAKVKDETGLAGSVAAREALTSGDIDMYWEYTGTGWLTHLEETKPIADEEEQFDKVAERDLEENDIKWIARSPANNTYAFAVRSEAADELGVEKMSDFKTLVEENSEDATVCVGEEFTARGDGLPGVEKTYDFKFPKDNVIKIDEGLIYTETDKGVEGGGKCNFGEVFITDGRIQANDLTVIEDDKSFFPKYNPALNVRQEAYEKHGDELEDVFEPIAEKLDNETLQTLNARVDVEGVPAEAVAEEWLKEEGFID